MSPTGGTASEPIWIRTVRDDASLFKDLGPAILITLIPVAIALLMQKPALRQAVVMRTAHASKVFCQGQADFWQGLATRSAQVYNKARL